MSNEKDLNPLEISSSPYLFDKKSSSVNMHNSNLNISPDPKRDIVGEMGAK